MFGIGSTEFLVILLVALVVLGPKSLASVSRTLGKAMGEFRRVSTDFQRTLNAEVEQEEHLKRKQEAEKEFFSPEARAEHAAQTAAQAQAAAQPAAPQTQAAPAAGAAPAATETAAARPAAQPEVVPLPRPYRLRSPWPRPLPRPRPKPAALPRRPPLPPLPCQRSKSMSTIQDKQDLAVTVTPSPQDAPVSSEAPQTAAGEDLPEAAADRAAPAATSGTGPEPASGVDAPAPASMTAPAQETQTAAPDAAAGEAADGVPEPPADSPLAQALAKARAEAEEAPAPVEQLAAPHSRSPGRRCRLRGCGSFCRTSAGYGRPWLLMPWPLPRRTAGMTRASPRPARHGRCRRRRDARARGKDHGPHGSPQRAALAPGALLHRRRCGLPALLGCGRAHLRLHHGPAAQCSARTRHGHVHHPARTLLRAHVQWPS